MARRSRPATIERKFGLVILTTHLGVFDHELIVALGTNENFIKFARWEYDDPEYQGISHANGSFSHKNGCIPAIWLPRYPRSPEEYGTLTHEVHHAVSHILRDWAGMENNEHTEEAFAHAMGFCVSEILSKMKPRK
jgi:hypothetical protein